MKKTTLALLLLATAVVFPASQTFAKQTIKLTKQQDRMVDRIKAQHAKAIKGDAQDQIKLAKLIISAIKSDNSTTKPQSDYYLSEIVKRFDIKSIDKALEVKDPAAIYVKSLKEKHNLLQTVKTQQDKAIEGTLEDQKKFATMIYEAFRDYETLKSGRVISPFVSDLLHSFDANAIKKAFMAGDPHSHFVNALRSSSKNEAVKRLEVPHLAADPLAQIILADFQRNLLSASNHLMHLLNNPEQFKHPSLEKLRTTVLAKSVFVEYPNFKGFENFARKLVTMQSTFLLLISKFPRKNNKILIPLDESKVAASIVEDVLKDLMNEFAYALKDYKDKKVPAELPGDVQEKVTRALRNVHIALNYIARKLPPNLIEVAAKAGDPRALAIHAIQFIGRGHNKRGHMVLDQLDIKKIPIAGFVHTYYLTYPSSAVFDFDKGMSKLDATIEAYTTNSTERESLQKLKEVLMNMKERIHVDHKNFINRKPGVK